MNKTLQRIPILWKARNRLRALFFKGMRHTIEIDETRGILLNSLRGYLKTISPHYFSESLLSERPYSDTALISSNNEARQNPIFVTARFRSGSTVLWNIFRNLPGFTAYYEPLNERRWFDSQIRGDIIDETHKSVENYWAEYDNLAVLGDYYRVHWTCRDLYMDETVWDGSLENYIQLLIEHAPNQAVLQFNRIDFRLPWIRRHFPAAKIIHLYRHPRDQWCSFLLKLQQFSSTAILRDYGPHDHFYLLVRAAET